MKIYLEGPGFTPYDQDFFTKCRDRLHEAGFDCISADGQAEFMQERKDAPIRYFTTEANRLAEANALVVLLDGPDVSCDVALKIGLFLELYRRDPAKKGILGLLTDDRAYLRLNVGTRDSINSFTRGSLEQMGCIHSDLDGVLDDLMAWRSQLEP